MTPTVTLHNLPPLSTVKEFATATSFSESLIRRAIKKTTPATDDDPLPPLKAKRVPKQGLRITAEAGAAWIDSFPDA